MVEMNQGSTPCVLIIAPHGSYRTMAYIKAAESMAVNTLIASEGKHSIVSAYAQGIHISFANPSAAFVELVSACKQHNVTAIIATDDVSTELATHLAEHFSFPHNPIDAVVKTRRKDLARECLHNNGLKIPQYEVIDLLIDLESYKLPIAFPVVLKPTSMSASKGVIRANNTDEFRAAFIRTKKIIELARTHDESIPANILVESFIEGREYALEGLLVNGELDVLAIFDKPDPLDGPYFEETYYITPTNLDLGQQQALTETVANACAAYGLSEGPVHAECRINDDGVYIIEVAARTIGGLCSNLLQFGTGQTLEQIVLSHAIGKPVKLERNEGAAGVLMIPITQAGVLKRIEGVLEAQNIEHIDSVQIQVRDGYEIVPLPEGASYLGFMFASAGNTQLVEQALREAHSKLNIVVAPLWKIGGSL